MEDNPYIIERFRLSTILNLEFIQLDNLTRSLFGGSIKNKNMISMTSTIFYNGKSYSCEFVKNVSSVDIDGQLRIYASRNDRRVFLVTEFNEVLATEKAESYQIDALLDDEDIKMLDFTALWFCVAFGEELNTIIRND